MPVYEISCYINIASIVSHFLDKKQIAVKYFSKKSDIYIPILAKNVLAEKLKFFLSKSK